MSFRPTAVFTTFARQCLTVLLLLTTVVVVNTSSASALAGGIDGCFFRDLNGSSVQGDEANSGASGETPFALPITVQLLDDATSTVIASTTTDPVTGCFEFPALADGDYRIRAIYPSEYYSSPTAGDTDFIPNAPPIVAGDPFTARYPFTYTSGDDLSISGGVSGLPELSLGYFITPGGDPMIETGTGPFNTEGTCPTQTPGDDCGTYDDVVRTNDITTIGYTITADNIPDGNVNPLNDVVLEQIITPGPGAVVEVPSLHPNCLTTGVSPVSSIAVDAATGVITVTCNLGSKDNGTSIIPTYIRTDGASENNSTFSVESRVYTGTDRAQVFDDSSTLESEEIRISAAPKFDITKGNDPSQPFNRVVYYQTTERVNPNTGVTEYGVNYRWDISVIYEGGTKGQAALAGDIEFSDIIGSQFAGWDLVACYNTPYGSGNMPNDTTPATDWGDRGTWSCVEDYANNEIDITVSNVDTDGNPTPTEGLNGNSLAAGPYFAFAGSVLIWYPLSEFYQSVDPSWTYGDDPVTGDYNLTNEVGNFDPEDVTGQSNYGDPGIEPTENNDRSINVAIYERGGFSKHLGSYEWADARIPDGSMTGTGSTYPCGASAISQGSLMSGQTPLCSTGDAPVQAGQKAGFWFWMRNDGTFPWPSETWGLCDAWDNSTMTLTTWTGGETIYVRRGTIPADAIIVEYATASFGDDVAANDWSNQVAAIQSCAAPNNDWNTDPYSFDADPATSLEKVGMVRIRVDETVHPEVLPSEWLQVSLPLEIRDTYNGGPNDGQPIEVGTILANNANRAYGSTDYSSTHMAAETYTNSPWGDRLFFNRHQVRVTKATSLDSTSPTDDDLFNVQGSDTVVWWLQPAVTAVTPALATGVTIEDTLPAGITFDAFCQASQAYPDANVVLTSVTPNPDGTTTLIFDLGDRQTNEPIGPIPVCTTVDNFLDPGTDLINSVEISSDGDVSPFSTRSDNRTVSVVASGELQLVKEVDAPLELQLDTQTYSIGWRNLSTDFDFSPPDVIDVWPYNGDAINPLNQRTEFDSNYIGDYFLTDWMVQPTTYLVDGSTAVTGGTWYYSNDDPNTIPYDADDAANDLTTGSVTWCTQAELTTGTAPCDFTFSDSTAARFVQTDILAAESTVTVEYTFQAGTVANPNDPANRYVNRFAARTDSVSDLIRSNEVLVQVLSMNLGDLVFLDADVDGKYTDGVDVPIAGTAVELWIDDGSGNFVFLDSTTTDSNGRYVFVDLLQGTFEVRIPDSELSGGTLDTWTQTILPLPADNDDNEDIDQQAFDSGLGYTSSGPVVLSADTTLDPPLGEEPTGENIFNLGNPYTYDNLTNMSIDLGFRGDPVIQIVKEVCDTAVGLCDPDTDPLDPSDGWVETVVVPFTDTAVWRISVINTGDEVLTNIVVDDDIEDTCDRDAAFFGDLGVGQHISWVCSTTNVVEDHLNTASVTAEGIGSGVPVEDVDSAAVETPPTDPDIEVKKFVNGDDAQTAPGLFITPGDPVVFTYEVTTGGGTVPLSGISVNDDNGTPLDATDDFTATYLSGDTDSDDRLDLGETWLFQATGFTASNGQYSNWVTAVGQPVTPDTDPVSDLDPAHYFGVVSGLDLTKYVNDDDANASPGVLVALGDPVVFTYEVENTGNAELTVVSFVDNAGTPADLTDDWTPTYLSGDTDNDSLLDVTETWLYEHTGEVAIGGPYTNTAAITAEDNLGDQYFQDDPANYFGANPSFDLEKATNGADADTIPVLIADNGDVTWTYELTNTGNVAISNPRVQDDNGTPADPSDDFYAAYTSGDTDNDGVLDVSEVWIFTASGSATEDSYTNNAEATGRGPNTVDEDGNTVTGQNLTSEDPSNYITSQPAIGIVKTTNGTDGPLIAIGADVLWSYSVTNEGNVPLANVAVDDDLEGAATYVAGDTNNNDLLDLTETWTFEISGTATAGDYDNVGTATGDGPSTIDDDGNIIPGEEVEDTDPSNYFGTDLSIEVKKYVQGDDAQVQTGPLVDSEGNVTFTYSVINTGNAPLSNVVLVDDNGTPADATDDVTLVIQGGDLNANGMLDLAETWSYSMTVPALAGPYTNEATVTGNGPGTTDDEGNTVPGSAVTDDDPANYFGMDPAIALTKLTNTTDNNSQPGVYLEDGAPITWTYLVSNPGNIPLDNVGVIDDAGTAGTALDDINALYVSGDINNDGWLDLTEIWVFRATGTADTTGQYTNNAVATGRPPATTNPDGTTTPMDSVTDDDPDNYFGIDPAIAITKATNNVNNTTAPGVYLEDGAAVTWTYTVNNPGNVALTNVAVTDDAGTPLDLTDDLTAAYFAGDANNDGWLDLTETWIFVATGTADTAGQYTNNAVVTGTPPDVTNPDGTTTTPDAVTDDDDDFYYGLDPEIAITKATNGTDSTTAPGIYLSDGAPITWTYTVTNPGNIALTNVGVTDDAGTPLDLTDDITATYVSGDTNNDGWLDLDETWIFEATGTADTTGQYTNNAVVTGTPPDVTNPDGTTTTPDPVTDNDDDFYFGGDPEIAITKATNTVNNTTAPGIYLSDGADITWTYTVTNPGNIALTDVNVVDDAGTPLDLTDDITATYVSGDTNNDDWLDLNEIWIFQATGTADTTGQYQNNAVVTGTPPDVTNPDGTTTTPDAVTDDDDDFYFGGDPEIAITKATNTVNSTTAPGVYLSDGADVTWTYTVTNPGNIALTNVFVLDDSGTPADVTDDVLAVYVSGDTNNDNWLDLDETWVYEATGTADTAGQYTNNAVVTGTPPDVTNPDGTTTTPDPATDNDDDFYYGLDPEIAITKATNGTDSTTAPGIYLSDGADVTWTYTVTNPGNIALTNVAVTDDAGTPLDLTDDITATYVSGDTNDDDWLDLDETWIFEATGTADTTGQYTNNADVTGTPADVTNPDGTTSTPDPVTDNDDDYYFGIDPAIAITKATNTVDSTTEPGVYINPGDPVTWTYTVTNPGNIALSNVRVVDDNGTVADLTDDLLATYLAGDTNNDGWLDLNEIWTFEATGTADTTGQYTNNADVAGTPPDVTNPDGTTTPQEPVTDDDDDYYYGLDPAIGIAKATNDVDSTEAPGVYLENGADITWTYSVTNEGNIALTNVFVLDDGGTPNDATDDVLAVYVSGDTNDDNWLDLDETWIYEATGTADTTGQYTNNAVVTGTPPDVTNPDGTTTTPDPVTDDDDDYYYGTDPAIGITKATNGTDNEAPGPYVILGDTVTWTYNVTNEGNIALTEINVVDDAGTPLNTNDDITATYVSGDTNEDGWLDLDETWIFQATGTADTVDQYTNNAVTTGTPPDVTNPDGTTTTPNPVTDNDDDYYYGANPSLDVTKWVNGQDANEAPGIYIPIGAEATWTYRVLNDGNTPLINVDLTDDQGVTVTCPQTVLEVGEAMFCTGGPEEVTPGPYVNIGTATGDPAQPDGNGGLTPVINPTTGNPVPPVSAEDPANHYGTGPAIEIEKQVCNQNDGNVCDIENEDHWTESTVVSDGDTAIWRMTVTNTGNVTLTDVTVNDPQAPSCDQTLETLPVGEVWAYTCELENVTDPTTNTAFVTGETPGDYWDPVTDEDTAETLEPPELALTKVVGATSVAEGETVTYTLTISNTGVTDAVDVEIRDDLPAGLTNIAVPPAQGLTYDESAHTLTWLLPSLPVGVTATVNYTAVVSGEGSIINSVEVLSNHEENDLTNNQDIATITATRKSGGNLAFTGSTTQTTVTIALILLGLGGVFVLVGRRREEETA